MAFCGVGYWYLGSEWGRLWLLTRDYDGGVGDGDVRLGRKRSGLIAVRFCY